MYIFCSTYALAASLVSSTTPSINVYLLTESVIFPDPKSIRPLRRFPPALIPVQKTLSPSPIIRGIPLPINPDMGRIHHLERRGYINSASLGRTYIHRHLHGKQDYPVVLTTVCSAARLEDHLIPAQTRLILSALIDSMGAGSQTRPHSQESTWPMHKRRCGKIRKILVSGRSLPMLVHLGAYNSA